MKLASGSGAAFFKLVAAACRFKLTTIIDHVSLLSVGTRHSHMMQVVLVLTLYFFFPPTIYAIPTPTYIHTHHLFPYSIIVRTTKIDTESDLLSFPFRSFFF